MTHEKPYVRQKISLNTLILSMLLEMGWLQKNMPE